MQFGRMRIEARNAKRRDASRSEECNVKECRWKCGMQSEGMLVEARRRTMSSAMVDMLTILLVMMCFCGVVLSRESNRSVTNVNLDGVVPSNGSLIPLVCQATRYPDLCSSSLSTDSRSSTAVNSTELVRVAVDLGWISQQESITLIQDFQNSSALDVNSTSAATVCGETLQYGSARLATSRDSLLVKPMQDIQAWLSAALQFQYDCFSALSNVVDPPAMLTSVTLPQINSTMQLISNALCMTDALADYGSSPTGWLPPLETRPLNLSSVLTYISPEWAGQKFDLQPLILGSTLLPNVTVSQDGSSNFSTVQEAVDNAPTYSVGRYVIYIKEGIYGEPVRVHRNKTRITFIGDGADRTVLTGNNNASFPGTATFQTASVVVVGDGFMAMGITFQNIAGPYAKQAVAVRVDSDFSLFQDCFFDGYQDTLYAHTGRQFYSNCTITGTVDFIFGNSASVFQNCQIAMRLNRPGTAISTVSAQGRTDPGQTTGLVFQNCTVTNWPDYLETGHEAYLGRPWKLFSRTIFISTNIDSLVTSTGWLPWNGDFALDSLLCGEYDSYGPGTANLSSRVSWSNQLTLDEAQYFSVDNFIQGSWWLPVTMTNISFGKISTSG